MKFLCFAIVSCFCFIIVTGQSSTCTTPNGETANCVTLWSCPILQEAYDSGDHSLQKFVEESACGSKKFTVCCGTSLNVTKNQTEPNTPVSNKMDQEKIENDSQRSFALKKLLPTRTYCGMQHYDDYFHDDNDTRVSVDEFPWLLDLESQAYSRTGGRIVVCSAVLISKKYALTIRSCIVSGNDTKYTYTTRVKVGSYQWRENVSCIDTKYDIDDCTDPIKQIYAEKPIYINNTDLVLLRLEETVVFTDYVRPICLPMDESTKPKINDTVLVTGWGTRSEKVKGDWIKKREPYRVASEEECKAVSKKPRTPNKPNKACVLAVGNQTVTCAVTQGGPTMYKYDNNWFASGIISKTDCNVGIHHVEPITPEAVNFILDNMKP